MASGLQPQVFLAGRVAVEIDGLVVDEARFPGRQSRLLFAYLVSEQGRAVPRDELAEALWGDATPATWDKALTGIVSRLRGLLTDGGIDGASVLTGAFGCYRLQLPEGSWILRQGHFTGTRDEASDPSRRSHFCLAANPLGMRPTAEEVNQMKLFTSLAVIALSLGEREEGQSLASEIVALALLVFAFFGALFLFKTMTR